MRELTLLPAVEMARRIRQKKLSAVELVEAHLKQIETLNPSLNAFVQVNPESALAQARIADAAMAHEENVGSLHGVPISIKSAIDVSGMLCEAGTRLRAGHVAAQDAPLVARLRNAGAIILGMTNTPELLMAWETDNLLYGRTNIHGTYRAHLVVPAVVRRQRSLQDVPRAASAAMVEGQFACRRILAASAG